MLTVISGDLGRIKVWAKGVRSAKHPGHAASASLCYSEFIINERDSMYTLSSASLIESFYGIRNSVESLALASYFTSLAGEVCQEGSEAKDILKLLLNCLHFLEKGLKEPCDLRLLFELRLSAFSGFMPVTNCCSECGDGDTPFFDPYAGGAVCTLCKKDSSKKISAAALELMTRYLCASPGDAFRFSADEKPVAECLRHMESFIEMYIGRISALTYLKNIMAL